MNSSSVKKLFSSLSTLVFKSGNGNLIWFSFGFLMLVGLVVFTQQMVSFTVQAYSISRQSEQVMSSIESATVDSDVVEVRESATEIAENLRNLRHSNSWEISLIRALGGLPLIGDSAYATSALLDAAQTSVDAAVVLFENEQTFRALSENPASLLDESQRLEFSALTIKLSRTQANLTEELVRVRQLNQSNLRFGLEPRKQRIQSVIESEILVYEWVLRVLGAGLEIGETADRIEQYLTDPEFELVSLEKNEEVVAHLKNLSVALEQMVNAVEVPADPTASRLISAVDDGKIENIKEVLASSKPILDLGINVLPEVSKIHEMHQGSEVGILQSGAIKELIQLLEQSTPQIKDASEGLEASMALFSTDRFAGGRADQLLNAVQSFFELVEHSEELVIILNYLFGIDGTRNTVVLLSTSDELRPGGGYVSALAHLEFDQSTLVRNDVYSTYQLESDRSLEFDPMIPTGLAVHMGAREYYIRDSLWSPDFKASANFVKEALEHGSGISPDVVVAVTQTGFLELIDTLSIQLPSDDFSEATGKSNSELLELGTDQSGADYLRDSLKSLTDGLSSGDIPLLNTVLLLEKLRAKHEIQLYGFNNEFQEALVNTGWSNDLIDSPERIVVSDANVGWNKVDRNIERSMKYVVAFDDQTDFANFSVQLEYKNTSSPSSTSCDRQAPPPLGTKYEDLINACYWNFVRVYPPISSTRLRVESKPIPANSVSTVLGYQSSSSSSTSVGTDAIGNYISALLKLAPADSMVLTMTYSVLGALLKSPDGYSTFRTQFFAQPGAGSRTTNVEIAVPTGFQYLGSSHTPITVTSELVTFELSGIVDDDFSIRFTKK